METSPVRDQQKPSSVEGYVRSCLVSLDLCLQKAAKIHPREHSMMEDQFARFCVWKDNIGVFSHGRSSLDHRLREAPEVREIIITLSETFNYRPQNYEYGHDVEPFLTEQFEHYIRDLFPDISDSIGKRLARTMVIRRKQILYRRSRYARTPRKFPRLPSEPAVQRLEPKLDVQSPTQHPGAETNQAPTETPQAQPRKDVATSAVQSAGNTATTLMPAAFQKAAIPSVISKSRSSASGGIQGLQFPPSPCEGLIRSYKKSSKQQQHRIIAHLESIQPHESHSRGMTLSNMAYGPRGRDSNRRHSIRDFNRFLEAFGEISCPFCFHFLPALEAADEKKWKVHVQSDLDPYVCLFEECDSAEQLYTRSHEWLQHMREHGKRWECAAKSHGRLVTNTRNEYLDHMKAAHPGKFSDFQLDIMADRNSLITDPIFQSCSLCGAEEIGTNIEGHIGTHMRHLALKSLPAYEQDAQEVGEVDNEERGSLAISGQQSRITVMEELEDGVHPLFFDFGNLHDLDEPLSDIPSRFSSYGGFRAYVSRFPDGITTRILRSSAVSNDPEGSKSGTDIMLPTDYHFSPPPVHAVSEDHEGANRSIDFAERYPDEHSCDFIEEHLFDDIPLNERRAYEWGFLIQDHGAFNNSRTLNDSEDDPILRDFRSAFVPDLEPPADWASLIPQLAGYDPGGDAIIQSFAAHARGDTLPSPPQRLNSVGVINPKMAHTSASSVYTSAGSLELGPSMAATTSGDVSPRENTESSASNTNEPRFAPSTRAEDIWVREQFEDVHEMLKRMDKPEPIQIAVLDTGCDLNAPQFLRFPKDRKRIIWRDFVDENQVSVDEDETDGKLGHGTLVVSLLLNLLPFVEIVVCRVAKRRTRTGSEDQQIAKALPWATGELGVAVALCTFDIASFQDDSVITNTLETVAWHRQTMLFVAGTADEYIKDLEHRVFPVWGEEMDGNLIPSSKTHVSERPHPRFCTLAGTVMCDWEGNSLSGQAVPITILAATAALFVQYTSSFAIWKSRIDGTGYTRMDILRDKAVMEAFFRKIGKLRDGNLWFVRPRSLFFDVTRPPQSYSGVFVQVTEEVYSRSRGRQGALAQLW
ncbi:serine/threonine protein phosphatase [Colletotrichum musicola]|uniref:Serine/threonine protein phosphatase n=1 Tax=Colletotrichum musicola TaxID=2175873 RepID=A0A8H6KED5_9PEZI|nr:serine/threonine protein phosphatase [Colletotrichum musicola]